ncbi:MAG: hypothetical protein Q9164_004088 [Protoblastenia rupestris]
MEIESQHFLACITCGRVVMWMQIHENIPEKRKKKINTKTASSDSGGNWLMVTLCHACDRTDQIRDAFSHEGVILHINKRMIETWYVYLALTRLVDGSIRMNDDGNGTVQLVNRGKFIHNTNATYELKTIKIHPDRPEDVIPEVCQHLVTGFF